MALDVHFNLPREWLFNRMTLRMVAAALVISGALLLVVGFQASAPRQSELLVVYEPAAEMPQMVGEHSNVVTVHGQSLFAAAQMQGLWVAGSPCVAACEATFLKCTHGLGVKAARYADYNPNVDGRTPAQIRSEYPFCKASFYPYTTSRCLDQC